MASIIIREKNLERPNLNTDFTDIAYVPGFGDASLEGAPKTNVPTLVQTKSEFLQLFGESPLKFTTSMNYEDNFDSKAYPDQDDKIFKEGDIDPAYMYAAELLTAGLPVYYERINDSNETIDPQDMYDAMEGVEDEEKYITVTESFTGNQLDTEHKKITVAHFIDSVKSITVNGTLLPKTEDLEDTFEASPEITLLKLSEIPKNPSDITVSYTIGSTTTVLTPDTDYTYNSTDNCIELGDEAQSEGTYKVSYLFETYSYSMGSDFIILANSITHEDTIDVTYTYSELVTTECIFDKLKDRGTYRVKYITTGGYPVFEYKNNSIVANLADVLALILDEVDTSVESTVYSGRFDAVALIDHTNYPGRSLLGTNSVFGVINTEGIFENIPKSSLTYLSMFTPWSDVYLEAGIKSDDVTITHLPMPASLLYLINTGAAVQNGSYWNSIAGVTRGVVESRVKEILTDMPITSIIANTYLAEKKNLSSINAITNVYPYGQTIMGIRTMFPVPEDNYLNANNILNIRLAMCDLKKRIYQAAKTLMFEQNSEVLWVKFKNQLLPLLEQMKSNNAIKAYNLSKVLNDTDKRRIKANLEIVPVYPVEKFDITIQITDELSDTEENI